MRLHLPKGLLHAVLTALVTTSAALVTLGSSAHAGIAGSTFYLNGSSADVEGDNATYCTWDSGSVYTSISTDPEGVSTVIGTIAAGDISTATINTLYLPNEKALTISAGGNRGFTEGDGLIIKDVQIAGDNGTATMTIAASQIVTLGAVSGGKLNVEFTGGDNYNRKLQIKDSSTISLGTIKNSWGLDAIDIEAGSQLSADTISFKSGDNKGTDGQGGKITGAGNVEVTTFDAGNVGNYTVSVDNFTATTINAGCAADRTLTLSSSNLTIGTLNHTSGKLVISSGVTAKITNLNLSGGTFTNNGTIEFQTGATVTLGNELVFGYTVGDRPTTGNGFGTVANWEGDVSTYIQGPMNGAAATSWNIGTQQITYTESTGKLSGTAIRTVTYIVQESATISDAMNGAIAIQIYGTKSNPTTLKLAGSLPNTVKKITANENTVFDINAIEGKTGYELILNGGTLTNNSTNVTSNTAQLCKISLTANSILDARIDTVTQDNGSQTSVDRSFGYVANSWNATDLNLGGFTLTKTGTGEFYTATTTLRGGGTLKITGGKFTHGVTVPNAGTKASFLGHTSDSSNTNVWLTGGELAGTFTVQRDAEIKAEDGSGTVSASITLASGKTATLKATGESDILTVSGGVLSGEGKVSIAAGSGKVLLNGNNTYTGGTTMEGGTLVAGHANALGTGALSVTSTIAKSTLDVASGVTLGVSRILVGETKQVDGEETTTPSDLDIKGSTSVSNYVDLTAGSSLTVKQDASLSLTGTEGGKGIWMKTGSTVNIEKGATVSAFGFTIANSSDTTNATLTLAEGKGNANLGQNAENSDLVINGADVTITKTYELKSKINGGTLTSDVQGARASGNINVSSLTVNAQKSLALGGETTVTGSATVSGALEIQSTGSLSVGADSTISTLTGSGTLKASGGSTVSATNSSGFSGTLDASGTDTLLNATGGLGNLKAAKASNGARLTLQGTGTSTTISVEEVVIAGAGSITAFNEVLQYVNVEAKKVQIGAGGGSLVGNLGISSGGTLTLDASAGATSEQGGTKGLTTTGSLTLGSGLTLNLLNLGKLTTNDSLKLFSGVTSLTFTQLNETGPTTATNAITTGEIDASTVFSGLGEDDFWLTYTGSADGGIVALVAQRDVPEPTTATLSLLALMGLAARRRRRKA